jgi:uncharacterized protein
MSVEVRPLGVNCNLSCKYCYQQPQRDADNNVARYDVKLMLSRLTEIGRPFTVFGGEPLLTPIEDLERLFAHGFSEHGRSGIQTNATLVTERHIALFKRYNVSVGVSMDGPGELNDLRWRATLEITRATTRRSERALEQLCASGVSVGLIITLHKLNASADRLPQLVAWLDHLNEIGVRSARTHVLEVDDEKLRDNYVLSEEELLRAMITLDEWWTSDKSIQLQTFRDLKRLLSGDDKRVSCTWKACDSYATSAVQGVEGDGHSSNCGRVNKEGIDFIKAESSGYERYLSLYHTPQEYGGCNGCRYFAFCKGQCPGTAIDGDWRNRSEYCGLWKALFARVERRLLDDGKKPLSLSGDLQTIEKALVSAWRRGTNRSLSDIIALPKSHLGNHDE